MRRRRNRATWFPILPTVYEEGSPGVTWFESDLTFNTGIAGDTQVQAFPLTIDFTEESDGAIAAGTSLRDVVEGQDYLLQRIVGKVWGRINKETAPAPKLLEGILCIAMAVLPSETGSDQPSLPAEEWNPLFSRNAAQPWIWRRTWRLDNPDIWPQGPGFTPQNGFVGHPSTTTGYTGLQEGGHVDSKVRRRIIKEHRLYIIAALGAIQADSDGSDVSWSWGYDLRLLGGMRRGRNKSSF